MQTYSLGLEKLQFKFKRIIRTWRSEVQIPVQVRILVMDLKCNNLCPEKRCNSHTERWRGRVGGREMGGGREGERDFKCKISLNEI